MHRPRGQKVKGQGHMVTKTVTFASDACCYGRVLLLPAWVCMSIRLPMFSSFFFGLVYCLHTHCSHNPRFAVIDCPTFCRITTDFVPITVGLLRMPLCPYPMQLSLTPNWPKSQIVTWSFHYISLFIFPVVTVARKACDFCDKDSLSQTLVRGTLCFVEYHYHASILRLEYQYFWRWVRIFVYHFCEVSCGNTSFLVSLSFCWRGSLKWIIPCRIHCTWVEIGC